MGKLIGKLWIATIEGLFQVFSVLLTYQDAVHFRISFIAFFIAMARWVINADGISSSFILGYGPKTNKVGTSSLGPTKSLIALKNI